MLLIPVYSWNLSKMASISDFSYEGITMDLQELGPWPRVHRRTYMEKPRYECGGARLNCMQDLRPSASSPLGRPYTAELSGFRRHFLFHENSDTSDFRS